MTFTSTFHRTTRIVQKRLSNRLFARLPSLLLGPLSISWRRPLTMLALGDLPLELLEHILRLADDTEADYQTRGEIYCTTALVARRWRDPSQRLLWEEVVLYRESQTRLFACSEGTKRHVTKSLAFLLSHPVSLSAEVAAAAIKSAHSLRSLDLNGLHTTDEMDASVLESRSLCGMSKNACTRTVELNVLGRALISSLSAQTWMRCC